MPNRIVDENWRVHTVWVELFSEYPDRVMIGEDEFVGIPAV